MSFDGVDDWIEVPTSSSLDNISTELTVSAWINPVNLSNGTHPRIVDRSEGPGGVNDRWLLTWSPTGTVDFGIGSGANGCLGNSVTPLNSWTHIAATFNNGQIYIYINGILDASATSSIISLSHIQNCNLKIGSAPASSFFPGKIENVHLWNTALSQIEIQQYMNCPPTGNEAGLVGYWNFEEGSGTTAYDQTTNGNDGTINGATYDTNVPSQSCNLTNANGCDSTAVLNLTINNSVTTSNTVSICSGDSFIVGTSTYNSDGTYTDVLTTVDGCDSTVTTILTIDPLGCTDANAFNYDPNAVCDDGSCIATVNGCTDPTACNYDAAANTDDGGCNYANTSTTDVTACDSYTWNDSTYNSSGTYNYNGSSNNYSMSFDGVDDYTQIINPVSIGLERSICFWAKVPIGGMNNNPSINVISLSYDFNITFGDWDQTNIAKIALHTPGNWIAYELVDDGEWHFYCLKGFDGTASSTEFFQDGILLTNQHSDGNYNYTNLTSNIYFGQVIANGTTFNGFLDNIHIWNTVLSQSEIQQYMNCPPTGNEVRI